MWKKAGAGVCIFMLVILGSGWMTAGQSAEETLCIPTGYLTLEPPSSVAAKRMSVEFPHAVHFGYSCQTCHHTWTGEPEIEGCQTSGCHDLTESPKKEGAGEPVIRYYKEAYHEMCIGCHKEITAENKSLEASGKLLSDQLPAAGPTSCVACHG